MNKLIEFNSIKTEELKKIQLKCGIEIHQQLNTGKLFCSCPCEIVPNEKLDKSIKRRLRFSLGESGEIDLAAKKEFQKKKENIYLYNDQIACLVDLDEEPPKKVNQNALETGLKISKILNLKLFSEIQFMRKLIINGSVTGGFQRTAILGIKGNIQSSKGNVSIDSINLEEDSARIIKKDEKHNIFALDRQGIPLIEITTGPQIKSPEQAQEVANKLGNILRSFSQTKRGLGTIRQDLNVSIPGGARIEIKGAQNLKLIPQIVENEMKRQLVHLSIIEELKNRQINKNNFTDNIKYDITDILKSANSKIIQSSLEEKNSKIFAIKLFSFKGILGHQMQDNYRFATEISNKNKEHFPSIKGLFHLDELPKYGIEEKHVSLIKEKLNNKKEDSFIILAGNEKTINNSLDNIIEIIKELIENVPSEVRQVDSKGVNTKFLRPMPGSARMYPETDIPKIILSNKELDEIYSDIPEIYDEKIKRLEKKFNLDSNKIEEILDKYDENQIINLINLSSKKASYIYEILFEIPKDIKKREKIETIDFRINLLEDLIKISNEKKLNQKIIRDIFISLYKDKINEIENLNQYLKDKNILKKEVSKDEIEKVLKDIIKENKNAPFGALMGIAMKKFNSNIDGKIISDILKKINN
jgi:glutamyl-tRNA(Gln) amidotransferase subunit E